MPCPWSSALYNAVFFAGFCFQLSFLIRDDLSSAELYTQMERVNLAKQTLPLRMSICVTPPVNITKLEAAGYKSYLHYQVGQSKFNSSLFGMGRVHT